MATSWTFNPFTGNLDAVGGGTNEFSDSLFRVYDNADATKKVALEVSAIATGTTRTITVPNENINLATSTSGSFANVNLSNLGVTSINSDLIPSADNTRKIGSSTRTWSEAFIDIVTAASPLTLRSIAEAGTTGAVSVLSGNSSGADSGDINLTTGTAAGARGRVVVDALRLTTACDIRPDDDGIRNIGTNSVRYDGAYIKQLFSNNLTLGENTSAADILIQNFGTPRIRIGESTLPSGGTANAIHESVGSTGNGMALFSANATASSNVRIESGNGSSGNSGDIILQTGTATGTRGSITNDSYDFTVNAANSWTLNGASSSIQDDGTNLNFTTGGTLVTSFSDMILGSVRVQSGYISDVAGTSFAIVGSEDMLFGTIEHTNPSVTTKNAFFASGSQTGAAPSNGTGTAIFQSGNVTQAGGGGANSGDVTVASGNSASGASGNILIKSGTASTTRGTITLNGSSLTSTSVMALPSTASGTPALTFTGDLDTGISSNAANSLQMITGGANRFLLTTTTATLGLPLLETDGSASAPSYAFSNDPNTGMYNSTGADKIEWATAGTARMELNTSLNPATANGTDLGTGAKRWGQLVCNNIVVKSGAAVTATDGADAPIWTMTALLTGPSGLSGPGFWLRKVTDPLFFITNNDATNDATDTDDIRFETGNKTAGTGDSGDFVMRSGTTVGGVRGELFLDGQREIRYVNTSDYHLRQMTVNTTNATTTSMGNAIETSSGETYVIDGRVMARQTGGVLGTVGDSAGFRVEGTFKNVAGTLSILGAALVTPIGIADDLTWAATVIASGANIVFRVTGAASKNITWESTVHVYRNS